MCADPFYYYTQLIGRYSLLVQHQMAATTLAAAVGAAFLMLAITTVVSHAFFRRKSRAVSSLRTRGVYVWTGLCLNYVWTYV
jgi:hypothetical protein